MYRAAFHAGQAGVFTKKEVVFFFEDRFFAQERALVNRFAAEGLPSLIERLHKAVGAPVNVQIDVPAMLATCVKKDARLSTARTLITRTKMSEKAQVAAKSTVPLPHLGPPTRCLQPTCPTCSQQVSQISFVNHQVASLASKASKTAPPPQREAAPEKEPVCTILPGLPFLYPRGRSHKHFTRR